jgi:hypothetical protein
VVPASLNNIKEKFKMKQIAAILFTFGALSAATAEDLSKYRDFQFGGDLATIAKQAGTNPSEARVLHSRPALIQELTWRPQPLGSSSRTEPAQEVVFSFCDGALYRIAVKYDRRQTEGMTPGDLIEAISSAYGGSAKPLPSAETVQAGYGQQDKVLAQWQDEQYRFRLVQSTYGSDYKLVGVFKRLEEAAQSADLEAARLDDQEAPQREAARLAKENETERVRLEQARLVNKPKFRP